MHRAVRDAATVRNVAEDFHTQVHPRVEQQLSPDELATFDTGGLLGGDAQGGIAALATWVRRHHPGG